LISPAECVVAVVGTSPDVPLPPAPEGCQFRFITSREQLVRDAADADVVFAWEPRLDWMRACWGWSNRLRWIATASAGVDWLMFPALVESDVMITNSAGIFDAPMAEYALALVSGLSAPPSSAWCATTPGSSTSAAAGSLTSRRWPPR
jgi:hypothetical protein